MRQDEIWDADAAERYDTPGRGMFAPEVVGPVVERPDGGRALEFAIGTGRIAVPLAERGVSVTGIELSEPMPARLRAKAAIPVVARTCRPRTSRWRASPTRPATWSRAAGS
ncbi:class I SAM-dependent methyltransferase [Amycolatopsis sp. NPDC003731]